MTWLLKKTADSETPRHKICYTQISKISLHPEVPSNLLHAITEVSTNIHGGNLLNRDAILLFMNFHPPHVLRENENRLLCFAGLRSYQLAVTFLDQDSEIPTIVHSSIHDNEVNKIAPLEAMFCQLIYGLDDRSWEIDVLRFWHTIEHDQLSAYFPGLPSKLALANRLGADRRRYSMKQSRPESKLQEFARGKSDSEHDDVQGGLDRPSAEPQTL